MFVQRLTKGTFSPAVSVCNNLRPGSKLHAGSKTKKPGETDERERDRHAEGREREREESGTER